MPQESGYEESPRHASITTVFDPGHNLQSRTIRPKMYDAADLWLRNGRRHGMQTSGVSRERGLRDILADDPAQDDHNTKLLLSANCIWEEANEQSACIDDSCRCSGCRTHSIAGIPGEEDAALPLWSRPWYCEREIRIRPSSSHSQEPDR